MRTIGFRSSFLLAVAAAAGLIASLSRPWYGRPAAGTDAAMEDLLGSVGRSFAEPGGRAGWTALEHADQLIAGLAAGTAALVALAMVPALQAAVAPAARWTAAAALCVVLVCLVDTPPVATEPRHGVLAALGCAIVLLLSTAGVAAAPSRRRAPVKTYTPPPPPAYDSEASYGPPQF